MSPLYLEIIIFSIVGILGIFAHAFKAINDKNQATPEDAPVYTFAMYWRKNKFIMFFVGICVVVFAYYNNEWKDFERLGKWRGLIMLGMGYMGDSAFPSLFTIIPMMIDKIKNLFGPKKDA